MSTIKSSAENLTLNADGANNDIKFQSNGSEVASIDQAGTITATNFTGTGGNLTVKSDGTTPAIILRDSDNNIDGMFKALNGTVGMQVTGGEWALLATTNAEISLYHDNAVKLATSALGVTVTGGVSLGGTAAANTLDDYEEGTWTPNIGGNATYSNQVGNYIKIGNLVWAHFSMTINAKGTGSTIGQINGLPFNSGIASQNSVAMQWGNLATAINHGTYYSGANSNILYLSTTTGSATSLGNNPNIWANGAVMIGVHIYSI